MGSVTATTVGDMRLNADAVPVEVRPFVEATSAMLGRVNKTLQQQQQFVADASHELRTPLALAMSTLQAARMRDRDVVTYKQALDEILEDLQHMDHLFCDLLALSGMDETHGIASPDAVNLEALLQGVAEPFTFRMAKTGGQLICRLHPAVVWGNNDQLARLFTNLLDNAVKHGPSGCDIHLSVEDGLSGEVAVCVQDAGGRIPPEALRYLFDRFYRVDPSRSSATGGAGLGLSIARDIALRHGGDISITSCPNEGTRVCVRLPTMDEDPSPKARPERRGDGKP
jgi:two-component system heavy metal sensor histidine kinase CusS